MELNWNHVIIWNGASITFIVLALIYKQDLLLSIGFIGMFAQSLPIMLWIIGKMFPDEQQSKPEVNHE